VLEPLLTGLAVLFALQAVEAHSERRRWWASAAATGLCLGLAIWSWPTALFSVVALGLTLLLAALLERNSPRPPILPLAALVALIVAAPLCLAEPFRQTTFALHAPSLLHLLILGALCLSGVVVHVLKSRLQDRGWLLWLIAAAALLLPLLLIPSEVAGLIFSFGGRGGLWGSILEQRPLFALSPTAIFVLLTYFVLALPVLCVLALRSPRPARQRRALGLLGLLCGGFWLMGLWQIRFIPLGMMVGAPLAAVGVVEVARRLGVRFQGRISPLLQRSLTPATALAALVLLWPAADYLLDALYLPSGRHLVMEEAGRLLRNHRDTMTAVMTPLSGGNPIVHLGRVPVVGSALVDPSTEAATRATLTFFTTRSVKKAQRILKQRRITHVIATYQPAERFGHFLHHLGRPSDIETVERLHRFCMASRLHMDSGSGAWAGLNFMEAVPWLAHRWENFGKLRPNDVEMVQLFEVVPGARLTGVVQPGELVEVVVKLLTNPGRPIVYRDMVAADEHGRFTLTVPYWTEKTLAPEVARYIQSLKKRSKPKRLNLGQTIAVGPALLRSKTATQKVQIPRAAVLNGQTLPVVFPPATPVRVHNGP
jgi:asparagine N-glycosylation enzyme membrane subunit Stt3